jgi:2-oxoisovalerate dehydrogenase E1 component alpha subunit
VSRQRPVLVEAMSYRIGHHSTSDDSFAYRSRAEVDSVKKLDNPLFRMRRFLESRGWWDGEREEEAKKRHKGEIMAEFSKAEKAKKPALGEMFTDVFSEVERPLMEQRSELAR